MSKEVVQRKVKVHTAYRLTDGTRVPSVTTVLSELAKPALIHWAWDLGIKGIDYRTFRDDLAEVGTLAHAMILAHIKGYEMDLSEYSKNTIDRAETALLKFMEWERQHTLEPIIVEEPMVSHELGFGGTPDYYGKIDGVLTLVDFKTGKGIYDEFFYQMGGYRLILEEKGYVVDGVRILRVGRIPDEGFEERQRIDGLQAESQIFLSALNIYRLKKSIKDTRSS